MRPKTIEQEQAIISSVISSDKMEVLELARQMTGYVVKIGMGDSANAPFAVIKNDESTIPILCKKHKKGVLLTDGGETFKKLAEPVCSYVETIGKGEQLNADLLAFTLKALIKKEVKIQNRELTVMIPSHDPSYFLSGCIALFACINGVSGLNSAIIR